MSGEIRMMRPAVLWGVLATVPAAGIAYAVRGPEGAVSVAIASALVLGNAAVAAALSALAGRVSAYAAALVSLPSFAFRMGGMFVALAALRHQTYIDAPSFALTFGLAVTLVLALESLRWKRTPWIALTLKEKS